MLALAVIFANAVVLVLLSASTTSEVLRWLAWILATIFFVSGVQAIVGKYGKK
mgnify:CR=1